MVKYGNHFLLWDWQRDNCMGQPASALKQEEEKSPVIIHSWLYVENPSKSTENLLELWSETKWINMIRHVYFSLPA